jgi:hypothetical protein
VQDHGRVQPVDAAVAVATASGVDVGAPAMLRSTNNTVAVLWPSPVVAKISDQPDNRLDYELVIGRRLARAEAPVGPPDPHLGDRVHEAEGFSMTFWRYLHGDPVPGEASSLARSLHRFHELSSILLDPTLERLASFDGPSVEVRARLEDPGFAPALTTEERARLCRAIDGADLASMARGLPRLVLHGAPHGYNVVWVGGEAVLVDLESVCVGPLEWDLAYLDPEAVDAYPHPVDAKLLAACRTAIAASTAAWCMDGIDRGPDMEWHARTHLASLERSGL